MSESKEEEFDVKKYFEWFDSTKALIKKTPNGNLGWFDHDLAVLTLLVQTKAVGATFDQDSALAHNFNRDGSMKER